MKLAKPHHGFTGVIAILCLLLAACSTTVERRDVAPVAPPGETRSAEPPAKNVILFIGDGMGVSTVTAAHRVLLPVELASHSSSCNEKVLRQGEWFFSPVSQHQAHDADRKFDEAPARKVVLGFSRNPHVAEQFVNWGTHGWARGKVRHPEHATLKLKTWHRVHRNQDSLQPGTRGTSAFSLVVPNWVD